MEKLNIGVEYELAIIFEKQVMDDVTYYLPYRVAVGRYENVTELFIDTTGNSYGNINCGRNFEENYVYGGRMVISKLFIDNLKCSMEEFKDKYLDLYNEYTFIQVKDKDLVVCINIETGESFYYKDEYTLMYDKMAEITEMMHDSVNNVIKESKMLSAARGDGDFVEAIDEEELETDLDKIEKLKLEKTPKVLFDEMTKYVKGQDETIKTVLTNFYQRYNLENGKKINMMLIGPTGVGKTYIFQTLSKLTDIPVLVYSVPGLSQAGYVGNNVDDILVQLLIKCDNKVNKAEQSIVILDEIDKLAQGKSIDDRKGAIATTAVQEELLKIIEGTERMVSLDKYNDKVLIDTKNIMFILAGAFQDMFEKKEKRKPIGFDSYLEEENEIIKKVTPDRLVEYGLKRELVGREPLICKLNDLSLEDIYNIIISENGELARNIRLLEECGVRCDNYLNVARLAAKKARENHTGARGIDTVFTNMFIDIQYNVFNSIGEYNYLVLGDNIIEDNKDYKLVKILDEDKDKIKIKKKN